MHIRRAIVEEADALSALAMRAKAHWGYSPAQIDAWRGVLHQSVESVRSRPVCVAHVDGRLAGFYALQARGAEWELDDLWVEPACMGQGVGRALLLHAKASAAALGASLLHIDADPYAERFYVACGAKRVGAVAAPIDGQPGRVRPQLVLAVG